MKKKLLSILSCLALASMAWAQTDVTDTYLTNSKFEEGLNSENVPTYSYDMEKHNTTKYGALEVPGWETTTNVDAMAGGVFAYGSSNFLAGDAYLAPSTDEDGNASGNVLGIAAVWGATIQYTQAVELPAGVYKLTFKVYSINTVSGLKANLFGFVEDGGTTHYATSNFELNQWVDVVSEFELTETVTGKVSIGFTGDGGSGTTPKFFIDNVKLEFTTYSELLANKIDVAKTLLADYDANSLSYIKLNEAIVAAEAYQNGTDEEKINAISDLAERIEEVKLGVYDATAENPSDLTSYIQNPNFDSSTGWNGSPAINNSCAEKWNCTFDVYQELTNLPNGIYELSCQGFYRMGGGGNDATLAAQNHGTDAETLNALLYAGDMTTPLMSIMEGAGKNGTVGDATNLVPNTQSTAAAYFAVGAYAGNTVKVRVTDGTLRIGVKKDIAQTNDWTIFDNFTLKYYGNPELDYSALSAFESSLTFGFEAGEYAPYNNAAAISALNLIKESPYLTQEELDADIAKIQTAGVWKTNATDVDAINNGDFAVMDLTSTGWVRTNAWGQFRDDVAAGGASSGNGYYNQPGSLVYGQLTGYTMPLKANTVYTLTFKYASWENNSNNSVTASVLNEAGEGLAATVFAGNGTKYNVEGGLKTGKVAFETGAAGNYVLTLTNSGNTVLTDISIVKAETVEVTVAIEAGKYATRIFPFAPDFGDADITAYTCQAVEENGTTLTLVEAETTEANVPYILYSETGCSTTLSGYDVATEDEVTRGYLTGVLAAEGKTITSGYVLQTQDDVQAFYRVDENDAITVPEYRAYLTVPVEINVNALRLILPGNGNATAISEVAAGEDALVDVYSISGVLVRKAVKAGEALNGLQKGIYVVNGAKIAVK